MTSPSEEGLLSESAPNGAEVLLGDDRRAAEAARREGELLAGSRRHSTDKAPPRREAHQQAGDAAE